MTDSPGLFSAMTMVNMTAEHNGDPRFAIYQLRENSNRVSNPLDVTVCEGYQLPTN